MKEESFNGISERFLMWIDVLNNTSKDIIPQAQDFLVNGAPKDFDGTPEQWAEIALRNISKRIDDILSCFDRMLASINMPKQFDNCY